MKKRIKNRRERAGENIKNWNGREFKKSKRGKKRKKSLAHAYE